MDAAFDWLGYDIVPDAPIYPEYTEHMNQILATDEGYAAFVEHVATSTAGYGTPEMLTALDEMIAQTAEGSAKDPHRYYDQATYPSYLHDLRRFVEARRGYLDDWLADHPAR